MLDVFPASPTTNFGPSCCPASFASTFFAIFPSRISIFLGVTACLPAEGAPYGTSAGYCAAGLTSIMNLLSLGALALFLPYLLLVTWALAQMEAAPGTSRQGRTIS